MDSIHFETSIVDNTAFLPGSMIAWFMFSQHVPWKSSSPRYIEFDTTVGYHWTMLDYFFDGCHPPFFEWVYFLGFHLLQEWRLISVAFVECRNSSDSCHQNVQRCQVTPLHSMLKVHLAHATMLTVTHRCGLIALFWTWKTPTAAANIVISIINLSKTKGEECRL